MNYKHLKYFLHVAEAGGITRAAEQLHLTPQTLSSQIQQLEDALGNALFVRQGRQLALTEFGRLALDYARDIFALGREMEASLKSRAGSGRPLELRVGVADAVPKPLVMRLLGPALKLHPNSVRLVCREWRHELLLADLALHRIDLVIADAPMPASVSVKARSHLLGQLPVALVGRPELLQGRSLPQGLDGLPMVVPGEDALLSARLHAWLDHHKLQPAVVAECDDPALGLELAREGHAAMLYPSTLAPDLERQFGLVHGGELAGLMEEVYVITLDRRISHPGVKAILQGPHDFLQHSVPTPRRKRNRRPDPAPDV